MIETVAASGWTFGISGAVALSAVAVIGYLFGRSQRTAESDAQPLDRVELQRAVRIARQLETIADDLRQDLALHRNHVDRFKSQLRRAESADSADADAWRRLRDEADGMVGPTLELVSQLSTAYDKIRQQSQSLANFTGGRTDPLTGLANSRSLEEQLEVLLRSTAEGGSPSSVVVVSIDSPPGERRTRDRCVAQVSERLARGLRGDDFAARFGVDELVVVLPATPLSGASVFGTRLRHRLQDDLGVVVSCGLAESLPADTPRSLLARADSAVYSARAAGPGHQYLHTGATIRPDSAPPAAPSTEASPADEPRTEAPEPKAPEPEAPESSVDESVASNRPEPGAIAPVELAGPPAGGDLLTLSSD